MTFETRMMTVHPITPIAWRHLEERLGYLCVGKKLPGFQTLRSLNYPVGLGGKHTRMLPLSFFGQYVGREDGPDTTINITVDQRDIITTLGVSPLFGGHIMKLWVHGVDIFGSATQLLNHVSAAGRGIDLALFTKDASGNVINPTRNGGSWGQRVDFGNGDRAPVGACHGAVMYKMDIDRSRDDCDALVTTYTMPIEWDNYSGNAAYTTMVPTSGDEYQSIALCYPEVEMVSRYFLNYQGRSGLIKMESEINVPHNIDLLSQFGSNSVPIVHLRHGFDHCYFYDVSTGIGPDLMSGVESDEPGVDYMSLDADAGIWGLTVRSDLTVVTDDNPTNYTEASLATGDNAAMFWRAVASVGAAHSWSHIDNGGIDDFSVGLYRSGMEHSGRNSKLGSYAQIHAGKGSSSPYANDENDADVQILDISHGWEGSVAGFGYMPGGRNIYTSFLTYGLFAKVVADVEWLGNNGY